MRKYKLWTGAEIKAVKSGTMPIGRTFIAVRRMCSRLGIEFPGNKKFEHNQKEKK